MSNRHKSRYDTRIRATIVVGVFALGMMGSIFSEQEAPDPPRVVGAQVPFYPPVPRAAHYDGVVKVRVTTDGERIQTIDTITGPPMLAKATQQNIMTWEFEAHRATTFDTTFKFRILLTQCDAKCKCTTAEEPAIVLHLPTLVEISAAEVVACDPIEPRK